MKLTVAKDESNFISLIMTGFSDADNQFHKVKIELSNMLSKNNKFELFTKPNNSISIISPSHFAYIIESLLKSLSIVKSYEQKDSFFTVIFNDFDNDNTIIENNVNNGLIQDLKNKLKVMNKKLEEINSNILDHEKSINDLKKDRSDISTCANNIIGTIKTLILIKV